MQRFASRALIGASEAAQILSSMVSQIRPWDAPSSQMLSTSASRMNDTIRRVPILESLFPGRGVSHKDLLPQNYEPPGGPVTDRVYMDIAIGERPVWRQ